MPKKLLSIGVFIVIFFCLHSKTHAEIQSCFSSITPTLRYTNSQATISVIVEQQSEGPANWVQVYVPEPFQYVSASATGWSVTEQDKNVTFTGGSLQPYETNIFTITINTGNTLGGPWQFSTYVADNGTGDPNLGCDGSSGLTIADGSTHVQISAVTLSNITDSQANLSFTTNIPATSQVVYGATTSYGNTKSNTNETTDHSFTLDGLTKNTTYHFQISTQAQSSSMASGDLTFTSAATSVNLTPTIIYISPTSGPSPTPIIETYILPIPTPVPDTKKPTATLNDLSKKSFQSPPTLFGTAGDNVSIASIEYTVDAGKTWNAVRDIQGLKTTYTTFSFIPNISSEQSNPSVQVRVKDTSGNTTLTNPLSFLIDTKGPQINFSNQFNKPFQIAPTITGAAIDNSGESIIEYALIKKDQSSYTFQPVDTTSSTGATTTFSAKLPQLEDGNYSVIIRATDTLGNQSTREQPIIIDRLPPQFGGRFLHIGPIILQPQSKSYISSVDIVHELVLSVAGGPSQVNISIQPMDDTTKDIEEKIPLIYSTTTNIWSGTLVFQSPGNYTVTATAIDGGGTIKTETLFAIKILPVGNIQNDKNEHISGTMTVLVKNPDTGTFSVWNGISYGQTSVKKSSPTDNAAWFLPPGEYKINVQAPGYVTQTTSSFSINSPMPVSPTLTLQKQTRFPFLLPLYSLLPKQYIPWNPYVLDLQSTSIQALPYTLSSTEIDVSSYSTLILLNTWYPVSSDIIEQWNNEKNAVFIFPHESDIAVQRFRHRLGDNSIMLADTDGTLLQKLPYTSIPSVFQNVQNNEFIQIDTNTIKKPTN